MLNHSTYYEELNQINQLSIPWGKLDGKKILITGGTGLIGSILVDCLIYRNEYMQSDIKLLILGRSQRETVNKRFGKYAQRDYFQYLRQDVSEKISIAGSVDYIIHAASKGDPYTFVHDPVGVMNANYIGMYQILELAKEKMSNKVLFVSSGEVYGIQQLQRDTHGLMNESQNDLAAKDVTKGSSGCNMAAMGESDYGYMDILNYRSCYASSKRAAETLCLSYNSQFHVPVTIARPCHTYAPTMLNTDHRVIGDFIRNALEKKDIVLKSQGIQQRSYCYGADTAAAMFYLLLLGKDGQAYNIANKQSVITIKNLAELLAQKAGSKVIYEIPKELDRKGDSGIVHAVLDATKLEKLGWTARYDINEGIDRMLEILEGSFLKRNKTE